MPTPIRVGGRAVKHWPDIGHLPTATGALTATDLVAFTDVSQSPIAMRQAVAQDFVAGLAAGATEMESATATNRIVTPRTVVNSPYVPKAWGRINATGGVITGVGVTYATFFATGQCRVIWDTAFSAATVYSVVGSGDQTQRIFTVITYNATGIDAEIIDTAGSRDAGAFSFVAIGDQ